MRTLRIIISVILIVFTIESYAQDDELDTTHLEEIASAPVAGAGIEAADKSATDKLAADKPAADEPAADKSANTENAAEKQAVDEIASSPAEEHFEDHGEDHHAFFEAARNAAPVTEISDPKGAFGDIDTNKDGKISYEELATRLKSLRTNPDSMQENLETHDHSDEDIKVEQELKSSQYKEDFERYDVDQDGTLSRDEITINHMFDDMPEEDKQAAQELHESMNRETNLRFDNSDADKSGHLDYKEFVYYKMKRMPDVEKLLDDMMHEEQAPSREFVAKEQLKIRDANNDGHIDEEEFKDFSVYNPITEFTHPHHIFLHEEF